MKTCGMCKEEKDDTAFSRRGKIRQSRCKLCTKIHDAKRFQEIKPERYKQVKARRDEITAWIRELKSNPCEDCGRTFDPVCMDWDHIKGQKINAVADMARCGISKERLTIEMNKCELVCSNCHRIRTYRRRHKAKDLNLVSPTIIQE